MAIDAFARSLFQLVPEVVQGAETRGQEREDRQSQQEQDALRQAMIRQQMQHAEQQAARNDPEAQYARREQELQLRNQYERERLRDAARIRQQYGQDPTEELSERDVLATEAARAEYNAYRAKQAVRAAINRIGAYQNPMDHQSTITGMVREANPDLSEQEINDALYAVIAPTVQNRSDTSSFVR